MLRNKKLKQGTIGRGRIMNNLRPVSIADIMASLSKPKEVSSELSSMSILEPSKPSPVASPLPTPSPIVTPEGVKLSKDQQSALETLNNPNNKFVVLTGAAGTGKTFTIKHWLYQYYKANNYYYNDIALCAFTGKACRAMVESFAPSESDDYDLRKFSEAITMNISTIHKLLGYVPEMVEKEMPDGSIVTIRNFVPTYHKQCKLKTKILIIDEISMLGLDLWDKLRMAIDWGRIEKVLFIGDLYQLQPVIGKSVFAYLAQSPLVKITSLETNHRQGEGNPILDFATTLRSGSAQEIKELIKPTKGKCYLMDIENVHLGKLIDALLSKYGEQSFINGDVSIITGANVGDYGQEMLNHIITGKLTGRKPVLINVVTGVKQFAVGDRVMFTKNNYEIGVINGTQGIITAIGKHTTGIDELPNEETVYESVNLKPMNIDHLMDTGNDESFYSRMASHSVTVKYDDLMGDEKEVTMDSIGDVKSLIHCYAMTCYKAQGSTLKNVVVFQTVDALNKGLISNEFLYTAVTRAKETCIVLYNDAGVGKANRRELQGATIAEKIRALSYSLSITEIGVKDTLLNDIDREERNTEDENTNN